MDIRKWLKKSPTTAKSNRRTSSSSAATAAVKDKNTSTISPSPSAPATRTSSASKRNRRAAGKEQPNTDVVSMDLDDDDFDDEEDFVIKRKRRKDIGSKKMKEKEEVEKPVEEIKKVASVGKKRGRSEIGGASGFGGGDTVEGAEDEGVKKKKKWVPRSDAPPNRGNKELPVGKPNCLAGKVFVITGILDSLLREECTDLVKEYGGRVVASVSKRVTHGVVGTEPGDSKMSKLKANRCKIVDEDALFEMIRSSLPKTAKEDEQIMEVEEVVPVEKEHEKKKNIVPFAGKVSTELWVDKYRPTEVSQLIANAKAIKDLREWLATWKDKFLYGDAHKLKPRERGDKGYAAAMLVGGPGIGKTTAAHIVCKELGFEPHEYNASDVRNKGGVQMLAETVMVANTISKYLTVSVKGDSKGKKGKGKKKALTVYPAGQVLIMDEVDGMSGGDRGGSQELIKMIKTSKVPIICIANDDSSSNMRSLANNCFKLRFRRPMVTQVTKRLVEIAKREGFRHLQDQTLAKLAEGCNGDIRQMINLLQTWRTSSTSLSFGQVKQRLEVEGKTVFQKSIFDLAKGFFSPGVDGSQNSLMARTENYFADSDLMPLFIHENYINTMAASSSLDHLADAAESIAEGDLCNSIVRQEQRWDLMPAAAIMSSIRPGSILAGGMGGQSMFPSFLGNMSKGNKWKRIVQGLEMKVKAVQTTSFSVRAFRLDYVPALTTCLATPLIRDGMGGVDEVVERLDAYYLERDPDWLEILDAGVYGKGRSPLENISSEAKRVLTREYNAGVHRRSTVTGMRVGVKHVGSDFVKTARKDVGEDVGVVDDDPLDMEDEDMEKEEGVEDVVAEFGIKGRKKGKGSRKTNVKGGKSKAASGKGRGRGRGRK